VKKVDINCQISVESNKILVVDDDETLVDILSQLLTRFGYEVLSACNRKRGLDLFMENRFDTVITDYDMPGMDGITLADRIKKTSPATLVILMTGHDRESLTEKIKNSAVDLTLFKPFNLFSIAQVLTEERTRRTEERLGAGC
jgi:DNA-binding NtrC family response regulator